MRPAFRIWIAAKRCEPAARYDCRKARLERGGEQRAVRSVRMADTPDSLRVNKRKSFQVIDHPAHVPNHFAHERPAWVLPVKCCAIVVWLLAGRNAFAKSDHIRSQANVAALHQLDGKCQLWIAPNATRFLFPLSDSLVKTNHGGDS